MIELKNIIRRIYHKQTIEKWCDEHNQPTIKYVEWLEEAYAKRHQIYFTGLVIFACIGWIMVLILGIR